MFAKTSFVFLVTLAIAQSIVALHPLADQEHRPAHFNPFLKAVFDMGIDMFKKLMKSLITIITPIPVLKFILTLKLHMMMFIAVSIFCKSLAFSKDQFNTCQQGVVDYTSEYMTPESIDSLSIFVHEALQRYQGSLNSSDSMNTEEKKLLGVESNQYYDEAEQSIPNDEDNETTSYI